MEDLAPPPPPTPRSHSYYRAFAVAVVIRGVQLSAPSPTSGVDWDPPTAYK